MVLFLQFPTQCIFKRLSELDPTPSAIPASVLIAAILRPFVHQNISFAVVTNIYYDNPCVVNAFFHALRYMRLFNQNYATTSTASAESWRAGIKLLRSIDMISIFTTSPSAS